MKLLLVLCAFLALANARVDYDGAQLLSVTPTSQKQYIFFSDLIEHYDVWKFPKHKDDYGHIFARPNEVPVLKKLLSKAGLDYSVINPNVGNTFKKEREENEAYRSTGKASMEWEAYHTYDEIMAWCDELPKRFPNLVTVTNYSSSYEGRVMKMVEVSSGSPNLQYGIFVDGGIHAREWISPAVVTYMMEKLLVNSDDYASTLDKVEFYFMPLINPDGYEYTWNTDRNWRKTRSPNNGSTCIGTDPNRNFDFHWAGPGSNNRSCSDAYYGSSPFSEIEMQIVRDAMESVSKEKVIYLTYHSYSQFYLIPWGYDWMEQGDTPPTYSPEMLSLGESSAEAIRMVNGKNFTVGNSEEKYGAASGASDDYSIGVAGYKMAYTIELRDQGVFGFNLPAFQIIPSGEETFEGFRVIFEYVRDGNPLKKE